MHSILPSASVAVALLFSQGSLAAPSTRNGTGMVASLEVKIPPNRKDDQYYTVDVNFGGQTLPCLMDTASADHFVASNECNITDPTDGCFGLTSLYEITGNENFLPNESFYTIVGTGPVFGNQTLMDIGLGDIKIDKIATGLVYETAAQFFQNNSFSGLLGLGMLNVSRQYYFNNRLPILDTLIQKGQLAKPVFSISLPRLSDPDSPEIGILTLGGIEPARANLDIEYHEVLPTPNYNLEDYTPTLQGWIAQMESMRMNGVEIKPTALLDAQNRSLTFVDSGAQTIQLRTDNLDSVAAAIKGPSIYRFNRTLYFDCSIPQLLELKIGQTWYPVDPLDLIIPGQTMMSNGTELCLSALGSWTRTFSDSILGTPFLRSVFSVYDFVSNTPYSVPPQIGLASTVNVDAAMARYPSLYKQRVG